MKGDLRTNLERLDDLICHVILLLFVGAIIICAKDYGVKVIPKLPLIFLIEEIFPMLIVVEELAVKGYILIVDIIDESIGVLY